MCTTLEGKKSFRIRYPEKCCQGWNNFASKIKSRDVVFTTLYNICTDGKKYNAKLIAFSKKLPDQFQIANKPWDDSPQNWWPV